MNDYVRETGSRTNRLRGFIDNCSRKIRESRISIKRLRAELGRRKKRANMSGRQKKKTGAGWVSRKYSKVSSSGFLVQLTDVVKINANQIKDAKHQAKKREENAHYQFKGPKATMRKRNDVSGPPIEQISEYWNGILGEPGTFQENSFAVAGWKASMRAARTSTRSEELVIPNLYAFKSITRETAFWKAAGPDQIKAFWWLRFGGPLEQLYTQIRKILECEETAPQWFVTGRTTLIPKPL